MSEAARADRRQRAREAYYDSTAGSGGQEGSAIALEDAIETATRVRITPEIEAAYVAAAYGVHDQVTAAIVPGLAAAFRAAGFEVEE